jgi:hypothetical protein
VADPAHRHPQRVLLSDEMPGNIYKRGEEEQRAVAAGRAGPFCRPNPSPTCWADNNDTTYSLSGEQHDTTCFTQMVVGAERDGSAGGAPAFAAKDVVVAVGSNFTLDPYDANDTLSQAVAKSFYQGLFGLDKEMKLQNVLAESYRVAGRLVYTIKLHPG